MSTSVSFYRKVEDRYGLGKKIFEFFNKLVDNPDNPGLNLEHIANAPDRRVRTARVDGKYRAVLFELSTGTERQFVVVDILNHDDAYDLATSKSLSVNPVTGVTELVESTAGSAQGALPATTESELDSRAKQLAAQMVAERQASAESEASAARGAASAAPRPIEDLQNRGIGIEQLKNELGMSSPTVAVLANASAWDAIAGQLTNAPAWEADVVVGLEAGMSIQEIREDLGLNTLETGADTKSDEALIAGLKTPAARMDFVVDAGEEELTEIIETGSFSEWRLFLHPSQRAAVTRNHSGAARITGGAGTGKTVVVVHRTKHLLKTDPGSRVFLTTYTRELADSLKAQIAELWPAYPEAKTAGHPGLWISGVDALVHSVLREATRTELREALKATLGIDGDFTPAGLDQNREEKNFWQEAAELKGQDLPHEKSNAAFLSQEYSTIILTHGITSETDYLRVRRTGRGTPLTRRERKAVWAIVEMFQAKCAVAERLTWAACAVVAAHIVSSRGEEGLFDHVLIDEAQDFHAGHWKFLRAVAKKGPNDLFIAEDPHQRIYGQRLVLRNYGIETRGRATTKLKVNYRTTAQTLGYATSILEGVEWIDSEEDVDTLTGYRSVRQGPAPKFMSSTSKAEEAEKLAEQIKAWISEREDSDEENLSIGVLTRTNPRRNEIAAQLGDLGLAVSSTRKTTAARPIAVMTMHNAKGLEFTHVVLLDVNKDSLPQRYILRGLGEAETNDALQRERALLYVAASRARDELLVSVLGEPSELLPA